MASNLISIIIPIFNNEGSLKTTYNEIKKALDTKNIRYELVLVDDNSADNSFSIIESLALEDPNVSAIKLVRNFGQHSATLAGIKHSKGDYLVTVDADLQNDPLDILLLINKLNEGYQVASGCRNFKHVPLIKSLRSKIANWAIFIVTGVKLKDSTSTFKAYRRDIIDLALKMEQYMKYLPVYVCWIGGEIIEVDINYRKRTSGKSQYNLFKLVVLFVEWLLLFSSGIKTVILLLFLGLSFITLCVLLLMIYFISLFASTEPANQTILISAAFSFFGGVNFIVLGMLSERVKQLQSAVNNLPLYIVDKTVSCKEGHS